MRYFLIPIVASAIGFAQFQYSINPITTNIKQRMINGGSYRDGCPISLNNLRYLKMSYIGFDNREHIGEMIVNRSVAKEVVAIFRELYKAKYPIRKMRLVSDYGGSDFASIEADNTSAFNCRPVAGTNRWSKHSYGKAIDINPLENPYIENNGKIYHKKSKPYINRYNKNLPHYKALIHKNDKIVKIFNKYGWIWGGFFKEAQDLQHFHKIK